MAQDWRGAEVRENRCLRLLLAQGSCAEVAQQMHLAKPTVGKWRRRSVARRIDGLLDEAAAAADASRPSREIGRASCRERVESSMGDGSIKRNMGRSIE